MRTNTTYQATQETKRTIVAITEFEKTLAEFQQMLFCDVRQATTAHGQAWEEATHALKNVIAKCKKRL
jgi:hypothetical protein